MSTIVSIETVNKTALSNLQKTFNRLKKKIRVLRNRLTETETALEQALHFFQTEVSPLKEVLRGLISDSTKLFYKYHKNSKRLSKKDRNQLKELIINKCYEIFNLAGSLDDIDLEVRNILKDLGNIDYQDLFNNDLEEDKEMISEMFKELNLDVNLSSLDASDDQESIMHKVLEAMLEAHQKQTTEEPQLSKPKSKKEIQKEIKAKELEKLQREGLGTLYKQLAKALHPDLEQDPSVKAEKEQWMKRLTTAYENEDLHTLLSIEMEWFNRTESDEREGKLPSDEQLRIFNSLLKDQVEELEIAIAMAPSNPRFFCISKFNLDDTKILSFQFAAMRNDLEGDMEDWKYILKNLASPKGENFVIDLLRERPEEGL
ncbi:MAG: hypothetical protein JSR80_06070 [Verrucomicrobia bacterium]|nr:hypothetical protein [Verrucomicrobiota bacterium]